MLNDKTVRGTNFTCFHAGPMESWTEFRLEPPDVPLPARGKLFLRSLLASAGLEISDGPLYFLCIQYRADSVIQGGTLDGERVEGKPAWPD